MKKKWKKRRWTKEYRVPKLEIKLYQIGFGTVGIGIAIGQSIIMANCQFSANKNGAHSAQL